MFFYEIWYDYPSRADQLEVLAPASLREWMGEMIRKMMGRYE